MAIAYPLKLNFKLIALAPRIRVTDATGANLLYVHQKALAFKEHIKVFTNEQQTQQLYEIKADRVIDFSARYFFRDMLGRELGSIKHRGMRSIWKAYYEIYAPGGTEPTHYMTEDNPWVKVIDSIVGEIPFLGMFTGYFFNPTFTVHRLGDDAPILHLKKEAAFFESTFTIDRADASLTAEDETRLLLAILMAVQLERSRG